MHSNLSFFIHRLAAYAFTTTADLIRLQAHSEEMARRLQPAIRNKTLSPVDRAALLNDAYALAKVRGCAVAW